jgi:hypothetical protein
MRTAKRILLGTVAAVFFSPVIIQAQVRVNDDGVVASPKVRQMLNEHKMAMKRGAITPIVTTAAVNDGIVASPKVRQTLAEHKAASAPAATETASYQPTGSDGITASPKLRDQLTERTPTFRIAPIK